MKIRVLAIVSFLLCLLIAVRLELLAAFYGILFVLNVIASIWMGAELCRQGYKKIKSGKGN